VPHTLTAALDAVLDGMSADSLRGATASLVDAYRSAGGEVIQPATVDEILVEGDRAQGVRLDDGRILRLSTDLVLETQQGPRSVNILSDYKVSASGTQLTLTELRSTRNQPVVYIFNRVTR